MEVLGHKLKSKYEHNVFLQTMLMALKIPCYDFRNPEIPGDIVYDVHCGGSVEKVSQTDSLFMTSSMNIERQFVDFLDLPFVDTRIIERTRDQMLRRRTLLRIEKITSLLDTRTFMTMLCIVLFAIMVFISGTDNSSSLKYASFIAAALMIVNFCLDRYERKLIDATCIYCPSEDFKSAISMASLAITLLNDKITGKTHIDALIAKYHGKKLVKTAVSNRNHPPAVVRVRTHAIPANDD